MNTTVTASRIGIGVRETKPARKRWVLASFQVLRRDQRDIPPHRTTVYAPFPEAADLGVGLSPDEVARRESPNFLDGIGASRAVKPEEVADFWENAGITVRGGGTEAVALNRATRMAYTPRVRGVLGAARFRLNQGRSLHACLGEFPEVFASAQCALAEAANELPPQERADIYLSIAKNLRDQSARRRRFLSSILDQLITAVMLLGLVVTTLLYFVPSFCAMFRSMDLDLPTPYLWAEAASKWIKSEAWITIPTAITLCVAIPVLVRRSLKTRRVQIALARCWGLGSVVRNLALSRSLPLFAVLHKAGVHPEMIFRLAGDASGNALVQDFFRAAYARCAAGMDMEKAFLTERLRLGLEEGRRLAGKVEAGGELGDLEGVLRGLAEEFSDRANAKIDALPKIVKPINLTAMGLVVALIAALVGMPSMLMLEKTFQQQNQRAHGLHSKQIKQ